jgi:hypothetical protein
MEQPSLHFLRGVVNTTPLRKWARSSRSPQLRRWGCFDATSPDSRRCDLTVWLGRVRLSLAGGVHGFRHHDGLRAFLRCRRSLMLVVLWYGPALQRCRCSRWASGLARGERHISRGGEFFLCFLRYGINITRRHGTGEKVLLYHGNEHLLIQCKHP